MTDSDLYLLRYRSLDDEARSLCFPCGPDGRIDLDRLTEPLRNDYLFARAVVGGQFARPVVERVQ